MDARQLRLARNEAFFREVNERINDTAQSWGDHGGEHDYQYLCECSNRDCDFQLPMSATDYERVRSDEAWFAVAPEHALPDIEDVVDRGDRYWIVQKRAEAAAVVAELDRRNG